MGDCLENLNISSLFQYSTEFCADSVEWCPDDPYKHYFVCGNYQLDETATAKCNSRLGRIFLFSISTSLHLHQTIETAGILDQKWCPQPVGLHPLLGVVNANKTIQIYSLEDTKLVLKAEHTLIDDNPETLLLSLDWSNNKFETSEPQIVVSDSNGNIHLFVLNEKQLILQSSWHGHEFQAWICGFYYWDPNIIFSGGDDSVFLKFDQRVGEGAVAKSKEHDAGVTSFHSNKSKEFCVISGSYDESVRLWDMRNLKRPQAKLKMPGPVWRLKFDPWTQTNILVACMLNGIHIIHELQIVASFYDHKSMAYGIDWAHLDSPEVSKFDKIGNFIISSCSFYDKLLCVQKCNLK